MNLLLLRDRNGVQKHYDYVKLLRQIKKIKYFCDAIFETSTKSILFFVLLPETREKVGIFKHVLTNYREL